MRKLTLIYFLMLLQVGCQKTCKVKNQIPQKNLLITKQDTINNNQKNIIIKDTVINDFEGNQLKLVYSKINGTNSVVITFNGKTEILYQTKSGSGVRFADKNEQYVFFENSENIQLLKKNVVVFSSNVQFLKFSEAKNYFIKNNYPNKELHSLKIISEIQFYSVFGSATTMGKEGMPTKIDFSKYYVVALIGKINNLANEIDVRSVVKLRNTISITVFTTSKEAGGTTSYSSRPFKILIIENKHQGKIKIDAF